MKERKGGSSNNPYSNISQRDCIGSNRYIFFYFPFLYLSDFSKGLIDKTIPHKNSSIRKITFSNFLGPQIDPTSSRTKISCFYFYRQYETVKKISFWREKKKRKGKERKKKKLLTASYIGYIEGFSRFITRFFNAVEIPCARWTREKSLLEKIFLCIFVTRLPRDFWIRFRFPPPPPCFHHCPFYSTIFLQYRSSNFSLILGHG